MQFERSVLQKALKHAFYEFWMLKRLGQILQQESENSSDKDSHSEEQADDASDLALFAVTSTSVPVKAWLSKGFGYLDYWDDEDSLAKHNAQIEAFAIHARGLLDFLYHEGHPLKETDVLALHFFGKDQDWLAIRPAMKQTDIQAIRDRVAREVAHLTYYRSDITPEDKKWPVAEIVADIEKAFAIFIKAVPPSLLPGDWKINGLF